MFGSGALGHRSRDRVNKLNHAGVNCPIMITPLISQCSFTLNQDPDTIIQVIRYTGINSSNKGGGDEGGIGLIENMQVPCFLNR